ncbi:unnamed protein product [Cylindrotheca closterium]|uniref:Uncharacterized protein n=1 Tax=Cylindrotheca closterium TaxID=2856 RepID=A0AAD2G253_9STRA|nr:unnamed protein product [Cylindrotheca closterium]
MNKNRQLFKKVARSDSFTTLNWSKSFSKEINYNLISAITLEDEDELFISSSKKKDRRQQYPVVRQLEEKRRSSNSRNESTKKSMDSPRHDRFSCHPADHHGDNKDKRLCPIPQRMLSTEFRSQPNQEDLQRADCFAGNVSIGSDDNFDSFASLDLADVFGDRSSFGNSSRGLLVDR